MHLAALSNTCWRERRLLELLVFKLEERELVLATGRTRWLEFSTREIDAVLRELGTVRLDRAVQMEGLARELGLGGAPGLRELPDLLEPPWGTILEGHRRGLLAAAREVDAVATATGCARGRQVMREVLAEVATDDRSGCDRRAADAEPLLDEVR